MTRSLLELIQPDAGPLTQEEEARLAEATGFAFALGLPDAILVDDNGNPIPEPPPEARRTT